MLTEGALVVSRQGHDRGRCYIVMAIEPPFVRVADGLYRGVDKVKTKRATHVARVAPGALFACDDARYQRADAAEKNAMIRAFIAAHREGRELGDGQGRCD